MNDIQLPALAMSPITLEPDQIPHRGEPDEQPGPLERITLGGPLAVPITSEYVEDDPQLKAFVEREADRATYHLMHLAVTFASGPDDAPLHTASVGMRLRAPDGDEPPVAWSMAPLRDTRARTVETTWRFGPELGVGEVTAALGGVERKAQHTETEVFVEALRLMRDDPAWQFQATKHQVIEGAHRLFMVVRARHRIDAVVGVVVTASVRRRGIIRYRYEHLHPVTVSRPL